MIIDETVLSLSSKAKMGAFLAGFAKFGTFRRSSKETGVSRQTVTRWLEHDADDFRARLEEAKTDFVESIEDKLFNQVLDRENPNPILLMFTMKAHNRMKYGDAIIVTNDRASELLSAVRGLPNGSLAAVEGEVVAIEADVARSISRE